MPTLNKVFLLGNLTRDPDLRGLPSGQSVCEMRMAITRRYISNGQEINETGTNSWGHNSNFSRYQTQVPFLLFRPGVPPAAYHHRTTHFDVAPTLLREVFGIASPVRDYAVGTMLTDPADRGVLVLANYTSIALMQDDLLVEMNPYGVAAVTDLELKPAAAPIPAKMLPQAAEIMARYRR